MSVANIMGVTYGCMGLLVAPIFLTLPLAPSASVPTCPGI